MKKKNNNDYIWHKYTENMFLGKTSSIWSFFNKQRLKVTIKQVKKYMKKGSVLDVGSYDGFIIKEFLINGALNKADEINLLDLYDTNKSELFKIINDNKRVMKKKFPKKKFNVLSKGAEELTEKEKYDNIFVFETIEHVHDEDEAINNFYSALKNKGKLFVSYPVEFGVLFFFKDLGRRFILRKDYHSIKELFYGLMGFSSKIKRLPRGHKGYDFRNTLKELEKRGFKKIKNKYYPINNKFFAYGGCAVLEKK